MSSVKLAILEKELRVLQQKVDGGGAGSLSPSASQLRSGGIQNNAATIQKAVSKQLKEEWGAMKEELLAELKNSNITTTTDATVVDSRNDDSAGVELKMIEEQGRQMQELSVTVQALELELKEVHKNRREHFTFDEEKEDNEISNKPNYVEASTVEQMIQSALLEQQQNGAAEEKDVDKALFDMIQRATDEGEGAAATAASQLSADQVAEMIRDALNEHHEKVREMMMGQQHLLQESAAAAAAEAAASNSNKEEFCCVLE